MKSSTTPLDNAIQAAGSQSALATGIGVSQQLVSYWIKRGGQVPAEYVVKVEAVSGISRRLLRPDLYEEILGGVGPPAAA